MQVMDLVQILIQLKRLGLVSSSRGKEGGYNLAKEPNKVQLGEVVDYHLPIGEDLVHINSYLGKQINLKFTGVINDISTGEKIKKSFGQGYSYKSFMSLARCDFCILSPEKCHCVLSTFSRWTP